MYAVLLIWTLWCNSFNNVTYDGFKSQCQNQFSHSFTLNNQNHYVLAFFAKTQTSTRFSYAWKERNLFCVSQSTITFNVNKNFFGDFFKRKWEKLNKKSVQISKYHLKLSFFGSIEKSKTFVLSALRETGKRDYDRQKRNENVQKQIHKMSHVK